MVEVDETASLRSDITKTLRAAAERLEDLSAEQVRGLLLASADIIDDLRDRASKWDALLDTVVLDLE